MHGKKLTLLQMHNIFKSCFMVKSFVSKFWLYISCLNCLTAYNMLESLFSNANDHWNLNSWH